MSTAIMTVEQVYDIGYSDGYNAATESGDSGTPDGGWDSWLINSIGGPATCRLFGEDPSESEGGWSQEMMLKLEAYNFGAEQGAADAVGE
jgi:hypothetical protein